MTTITVETNVHRADDVTFLMSTGEFLDAIGPVDQEVQDALNDALDAFVDEHAYYRTEQWYSLLYERDPSVVLRTALAVALEIDEDDLSADYSFCTCNWTNNLSDDFGGTLWCLSDGRRFLTVESGDFGCMRATVEVRAVECEEPPHVIAYNSSELEIGCTDCEYSLDTGMNRIEWTDLTRVDDDGSPLEGLFCPKCGHPMVVEVWI